jgi:glycosyltransferase involved in cell wall biosynthesis
MRVCLLSTSDGRGGAYTAAYRLHRGLLDKNIDSTMIVGNKVGDDPTVWAEASKKVKLWEMIARTCDSLPLRLYPARDKSAFSLQWFPGRVASIVKLNNPDIIHLHWVCGGYLSVSYISKFNKPIVWTLHDMWPFTGGCHYDEECGRYKQSCGACPILHASNKYDLSGWVWKRKHNAWKHLHITVVASSNWIAECARASSLFKNCRIVVLPNGIDVSKYKPLDQSLARDAYDLPRDRQLILFSASLLHDKRKGLQFLIPALRSLAKSAFADRYEFVILGASESVNDADFGLKTHYVAHLHDEISQVLLYSAADVLVAPSMQENLSNTVMESLACGTPVVAFNIGGMPDMIRHKGNGYLAEPFSSKELAEGIKWVLQGRLVRLSQQARDDAVNQYALENVAAQYQALYRDILG